MLSFRELERAARILDRHYRDARVEKIVQAEPYAVVLSLYGHDPETDAGEKRHLQLRARPDFARVGQLPRPPRAPLRVVRLQARAVPIRRSRSTRTAHRVVWSR